MTLKRLPHFILAMIAPTLSMTADGNAGIKAGAADSALNNSVDCVYPGKRAVSLVNCPHACMSTLDWITAVWLVRRARSV